ncbi:MAG: hypothetical protein ACR2LC_10870 [Pyrinomonadaceae bacterium]
MQQRRLLLRFFSALCLIFVVTLPMYAQSKDESSKKTITVCRIELAEMGKTARFHFNYIYSLDIKSDGSVKEISKVREKDPPAFVHDDKIVECMKKMEACA